MSQAKQISNLLDMQVSRMKQPQELQGYSQDNNAKALKENCKTQQSNVDLFPEVAVSRIFERLTVMHGRAFTSVNGRSAVDASDKLTLAGETWQICLTGVSYEQVADGLSKLATTDEYDNYSITAKQFRTLCLGVGKANVPSIEQVVRVLANSAPRKGTVVERYQHPLILAVSKDKFFDCYLSRNGSTAQCVAMVRPIYNRILKSGWAEFNSWDYEELVSITAPSKTTKSVAMAALAALKSCGLVTEEKVSKAKEIIEYAEFKEVVLSEESTEEILVRLALEQPTQKEIELKERVKALKIRFETESQGNVSVEKETVLKASFEGLL